MGDPAIPRTVDDITLEWLTAVLQERAPGARVVQVEVLAAHSGTTGRAKVGLTTATDAGATDVPATLFVKLAPFDERQRRFLDFTGIGRAEAHLYALLAGSFPVRVPDVWYAAVDGNDFVMVLEDLEASGCTFPRPSDADVADRARSTVEELAALHAACWESDRFAGDLAWVPERAGFGGDGKDQASARAAGGFIRRALDQFAGDMPSAFRAVGDVYVERT